MKIIIGVLLVSALTMSLSAMSLDSKLLEKDSLAGIASTASNLVELFDKDKTVEKSVSSLLGGLKADDALKAVGALKGLSSLDFSKEQLGGYGALLAQVAPMLLSQNFDLENGELGKYIGKAMAYLESENFAKASGAVKEALKYVDTEGLQKDLLTGLISSYAPMLEGIDLGQAVEIGKSLLDGVSSSKAQ